MREAFPGNAFRLFELTGEPNVRGSATLSYEYGVSRAARFGGPAAKGGHQS